MQALKTLDARRPMDHPDAQAPLRNMPLAPDIARTVRRMLLFGVLVIISSGHVLGWKDGELSHLRSATIAVIVLSSNLGKNSKRSLGSRWRCRPKMISPTNSRRLLRR